MEKIKFKPLHEGMGFHPFSDGLPYAPETKKAEVKKAPHPTTHLNGGTGAISAGRPRFATQFPQSQPSQTARQLQQQTQMHVNPLAQASAKSNKATALSPQSAPITSADAKETLLRRRFFAYLMDTVIHAGFWLATNLAALFFFKFQLDSDILKNNFFSFFLFFVISQWIFVALQEVLFENSIGKVFFNLEFKRNHRSLFLRSIVFVMGACALGLGFFFRPQDYFGKLQLKS